MRAYKRFFAFVTLPISGFLCNNPETVITFKRPIQFEIQGFYVPSTDYLVVIPLAGDYRDIPICFSTSAIACELLLQLMAEFSTLNNDLVEVEEVEVTTLDNALNQLLEVQEVDASTDVPTNLPF